jgi:PAS domain S-box-containing protein
MGTLQLSEALLGALQTHAQLKGLSVEVLLQEWSDQAPIHEPLSVFRVSEYQLFRALFEQNTDGIYLKTPDQYLIICNDSFAEMLGYSRTDLAGMSISEFVQNFDRDHAAATQAALAAGQRPAAMERTFIRKDGSTFQAEVTLSIVRDEAFQPVYFQAIVRDITERKQAEQERLDFLNDLRALQQLSIELADEEDLDQLYRRSVELIKTRLDIDRLAIFLVDEAQTHIKGTFGVDQDGNLRDEHALQETITPDHWAREVWAHPEKSMFWPDAPLSEHADAPHYTQQVVVGRGWRAATALWDSEGVIGYFLADNLIQQRPARSYQSELIGLLGGMLSRLLRLKQKADYLRRSEARFRMLFEAAPIGVSIADNFDAAFVPNQTYAQFLGYSSPQEMLASQDGGFVETHTVAEDFALEAPRLRDLEQGHFSSYRMEKRYRTYQGDIRWGDLTAFVARDEHGHVLQTMAMVIDISAQKEAEQRLLRREAILEEMGRIAQVGGWEYDLTTQRSQWTDMTYRIHGVEPDDLSVIPTIVRNHTPQVQAALQQLITTGESFDLEALYDHPDGTQHWLHIIGKAEMHEGRVARIFGTIRDNTQRKNNLVALQTYAERLRLLFEESPVAIMIGEANDFTSVNQRLADYLGYDKAEILAMSAEEFIRRITLPEDLPTQWGYIAQIQDGRLDSYHWARRFVRQDGQIVLADLNVYAIREQGRIKQVVSILIDITAQYMAQNILVERERLLQEMGEVASVGGWQIDLATQAVTWTLQTYQIYELVLHHNSI